MKPTQAIRQACQVCSAEESRRPGGIWARGLCVKCYRHHWMAGTLDRFPRRQKPRAEVIEDWIFLSSHGLTQSQAAERMGMSREALAKAIARAKRDHDPLLERLAA